MLVMRVSRRIVADETNEKNEIFVVCEEKTPTLTTLRAFDMRMKRHWHTGRRRSEVMFITLSFVSLLISPTRQPSSST